MRVLSVAFTAADCTTQKRHGWRLCAEGAQVAASSNVSISGAATGSGK